MLSSKPPLNLTALAKPEISAWTMTLVNGTACILLGASLFFLLTNGIPLIQLGVIAGPISKGILKNWTRLSLSLCYFLFLVFAWKYPKQFDRLWVVRFAKTAFHKISLPMWTVLILLGYFGSHTIVGFARHLALETRAFDLGIFAQAIWNTLQGHFLYSSLKGGICLLGDHMSPILVLLAPFYALWPDPRLLLIFQNLAAASNLFLIAAIAKRKTGDSLTALVFAIIYAFYLPTRGALHEDFHPEVLVEPFLFAAFIFLERKSWAGFLMCLLAAVAGKENMLGIAFVMGYYAWRYKQSPRIGLGLMIASVVLFGTIVKWAIPLLSGKPYLYEGFYRHLFSDPWVHVVSFLFSLDSLEYILKLFVPFLFLPLFHWPTFLLGLPILFQNLLSNNPVFRSFGYHYTTGLTPFLFISSIYGFHALSQKFKEFFRYQKVFLSLLLLVSLLRSLPSEYFYFWESRSHQSAHRRMIRERLAALPSRYSLLTHNNLIPQAANRKQVYQFEYVGEITKAESAKNHGADYVALERDFWEPGTLPLEPTLQQFADADYVSEFQENGFYLLRHSNLGG